MALVAALFLTALSIATVLYPYQTSYIEGYMLDQAARLADGGPFYRDITQAPWVADNFPPLYPLLLAVGVQTFGAGFAFGRMLTLASVAGLAGLAYAWHRRQGSRWPIAVALVGLWLASSYVLRRGVLVRMDLAAILLAGAGLLGYLHLEDRRPRLAVGVALAGFVLALGTRQTLVAAPAALLVALAVAGRWRHAAAIGLGVALAGVVAVVTLQAWTDGLFWQNVVVANRGNHLVLAYLERAGLMVLAHIPLLVLGGLGAWEIWRSQGLEARALSLWLVTATLVTWTAGKAGATYNHFLELLFVVGLLVSHGIAWLARREPVRAWDPSGNVRGILAVALAAQLVITGVSPATAAAVTALEDQEGDARLVAFLAANQGPVLSENAGAAVQAGHPVVLEPRTFRDLDQVDRWDDAGLVASLEERRYTLVVTETFEERVYCDPGCRWPVEAWGALERNYEPTREIGHWQIWRPA